MKTISSFFNGFNNKECYIIGKGPTDYNYQDLSNLDCPLFFINESILLSKEVRPGYKNKTFVFSHDISTKSSIVDDDDFNCILSSSNSDPMKKYTSSYIDINGIPVSSYAYFYEKHLNIKNKFLSKMHSNECEFSPTEKDRHDMFLANWLPYKVGTIRTVIGFAFYTGIKHINLIGCDGLPKKEVKEKYGSYYEPKLKNYIVSKPYGNHLKHKNRAIQMMKNCEITYEFLGTPVL